MINLNVDIDTAAIKRLADSIRQQIEDKSDAISKETAEVILGTAKNRCPVASGELKDSAYIEKTETGYTVGFSAEHAIFAHEQPQSMRKNGESRFLASAVEDIAGNGGLRAIIEEGFKNGI